MYRPHTEWKCCAATEGEHRAISLLVTVLDGNGEVAHQQVGLGVDRRDATGKLEKLATAKGAR